MPRVLETVREREQEIGVLWGRGLATPVTTARQAIRLENPGAMDLEMTITIPVVRRNYWLLVRRAEIANKHNSEVFK